MPYIIFAALLITAAQTGRCDPAADAPLTTFQKFVNGEVPVKEAVVYRELSNTNGKVLNKEWWRFAYQNDSWFVQRLKPDTNNSTNLIPINSDVDGASFKQLWSVSDESLLTAGKDVAKESLLDKNGFNRQLMFCALSLGIPRQLNVLSLTDAPVKWNGSQFNTTVVTKYKRNIALTTTPLASQLALGSNGCPLSAELPGISQYPHGIVTYDYSSSIAPGIPGSFTEESPNEKFKYEFVSLTLGSNDLTATAGYVPSMFADMKLKRHVYLYTNEFAFEQMGGKSYPAFRPHSPKLGEPPPPLLGTKWFNSTNPLTLSDLHGKVVLLDFWSVSCPDCIIAFPKIDALYQKNKDEGFIVIGVCGGWGSEKRIATILKDRNVTFPTLVDKDLAIADEQTGYTSYSYVNDADPSYALIDKSGNLVWKSTLGVLPIESQIKNLLEDVSTK